jgi:hypothetical protein
MLIVLSNRHGGKAKMPDTDALETTPAEVPEEEHSADDSPSSDRSRRRAPSKLSRRAAAAAEAAYILEAVRR